MYMLYIFYLMKGNIMKKLLILILSAMLLLSICSCDDEPEEEGGECTEHVDEDGNSICDSCFEFISNAPATVTVTFTVKDREERTLSGISVTLTPKNDGDAVTAVSGADGRLTATLTVGSYNVSYDYNVDEIGYYLSHTTSVNVKEDTAALDLYLINNNPNGTQEKPFSLSVDENNLTIPESTSYYYIIYRAVDLTVNIEAQGIKVTYGTAVYTPDANGVISFALMGTDINSAEMILIENLSSSELSFSVDISSLPGTFGNPIEIEHALLGTEISVSGLTSNEDLVYYSFTATAAGNLTLTLTSESSYIGLINMRNSVAANTDEADSNTVTISVAAGDEILIDCASLLQAGGTVTFIPAFALAE